MGAGGGAGAGGGFSPDGGTGAGGMVGDATLICSPIACLARFPAEMVTPGSCCTISAQEDSLSTF